MITFTTVVFALVTVAAARDIPKFLQVCKQNDPNVSACILKSINSLRPNLAKGIPELNVPPSEPLELNEVITVQGNGIKLSTKNIKSYGTTDFTISHLKVDIPSLVITADVFFPNLYITAAYKVDGQISLLPLKGSGPMSLNCTGYSAALRTRGDIRKNKAGEEIWYYTDLTIKITTGKGSMQLENLFGGDPSLGEVVNSAINANFDVFQKEFLPAITQGLQRAVLKLANTISTSFLYKQIFPKS